MNPWFNLNETKPNLFITDNEMLVPLLLLANIENIRLIEAHFEIKVLMIGLVQGTEIKFKNCWKTKNPIGIPGEKKILKDEKAKSIQETLVTRST